jgi:hypothetical protein
MLGYRKRIFSQACGFLHTLRNEPANLGALKQFQQLLLGEIVRTEIKIRDLKKEMRAFPDSNEEDSARRIEALARRLEGYRHRAYIWRCFGDGIAYLYMDKYALKQTYYNTDTPSVKQDAGFITGKTGIAQEIRVLEEALRQGVPALLTDLTNTIRHGDVCLMDGSDPFLIEVKTTKKLDSRGKQQRHRVRKLHDFFATDRAEGFRGYSHVRRESHALPEQDYVEQLNACIVKAKLDGFAACQPERGVCYIVETRLNTKLAEFLPSLRFVAPWFCFLNELKNTRSWAPYRPFVLTIEREADLWGFIRGEILITIVVDINVLCEIASGLGY